MSPFRNTSLYDSFLIVEGIRPCGFRGKRLKPVSRTRAFNWEQFWSRVDGELINRQRVWFPGVCGFFSRILISREDWWTSFSLTVLGTNAKASYELSFQPGSIRIEDPDNLPVY